MSLNYGLLRYDYTDTFMIVANSLLINTLPTLTQYLLSINIPIVQAIPDAAGIYCILDINPDVYKVYVVYFDNESSQYIHEYQYSLQWLLVLL